MQCDYCERHCELKNGESGFCCMYTCKDNRIVERRPGVLSSVYVSHIESLPFYHAYPGSRSLVIGTMGCNFDCHYCSNAHIARSKPDMIYPYRYQPEQVIRRAIQAGCHNIVFSVNEPIVSWPYVMQIARCARNAGIPMGCLTNGYATEGVIAEMGQHFAFVNISLKSISPDFYRKYTGGANIDPVLRNIRSLAGMTHVELTTPVIEDLNNMEIPALAEFIYDLNPEIPWHLFRLLPEYKMNQASPTSIYRVTNLIEKAAAELPYVYFSNFVGATRVSTVCPECGYKVIDRISSAGCGSKMVKYCLEGNSCPCCGKEIQMAGKYMEWNRGRQLENWNY